MSSQDLARLGRTAVHLRPRQVAHRVRLSAQRGAVGRWPRASGRLLAGPVPAAAAGWPDGFRPLDAGLYEVGGGGPARLDRGRITLLGRDRELCPAGDWRQADWRQAEAPLLWRFHLHYWDWAFGLAAEGDRPAARAAFAAAWRSWQDGCEFGRGDAWRPYPAAVRAWSWCGLYRPLVAGTGLAPDFTASLARHAGFLRAHLETDVGGNHLVKDLKALAGLGVFLRDRALLARAARLLAAQLAVQVLPDGGHYERAPAYHCQVLADLIDVAGLLGAAGHPPVPGLAAAVGAMRRWLAAVTGPDGTVPLLNDGYPVPAALLAALRPGPEPAGPLTLLAGTGLARAQAGDWRLLADVGPACPDELPAHAHADTLSCLVHVAGRPLLIDTGTSGYQAGPERDYQRSTAAHNTLEIDGENSTEVWGAFRAGRRARVRDVAAWRRAGQLTVSAEHDGYRHLPGRPVHRRRWRLTAAGLEVTDEVTGTGRHDLAVRWHLPPGAAVSAGPGGARVTASAGSFTVAVAATAPLRLGTSAAPVAAGFGRTVPAPVLTCRLRADLPAVVTTRWQRAAGTAGPAASRGRPGERETGA